MTTNVQPQDIEEQRLAGIQVPDAALHARYLAGGLTGYPYEFLMETLAAADALVRQHQALCERVWAITQPYEQPFVSMYYAPPRMQELYEAACIEVPIFCKGNIKRGGTQEQYPIATWRRQMATYRRAIKAMTRLLQAAEADWQEELAETEAWAETLRAADAMDTVEEPGDPSEPTHATLRGKPGRDDEGASAYRNEEEEAKA